jgi:hypothetical protein
MLARATRRTDSRGAEPLLVFCIVVLSSWRYAPLAPDRRGANREWAKSHALRRKRIMPAYQWDESCH